MSMELPGKSRQYLFDLHVHSNRSQDSDLAPGAAISRARELGLRGIAITDHDRLTVIRPAPADLVLVPGAELTTEWGDLLALGISELPGADLSVPEIIGSIHSQGGLAVVPHPFSEAPYAMNERLFDVLDLIDGLEVTSPKMSVDNRRARKVAGQNRKARVDGSDAHSLADMGRGWTACDSPDVAGLLDSIRNARTQAFMGKLR
jgi:predicted metal-dependent phosphoesterase TrpH